MDINHNAEGTMATPETGITFDTDLEDDSLFSITDAEFDAAQDELAAELDAADAAFRAFDNAGSADDLPAYRYEVTGPLAGGRMTVERRARNRRWHLSTGVHVYEQQLDSREYDLELLTYVAAYLNSRIKRTTTCEGLAPIENVEAIVVKHALDSVVYEMADGDVDETGVWIDAACWADVDTTRTEAMS